MASPFASTLRSLERDTHHGAAALGLIAALLVTAWGAWLGMGRLPQYVRATTARLEADSAPRRADASTSGIVSRVRARLGQLVRQGDTLLELDSGVPDRDLQEAMATATGLERQLAVARRERTARVHAFDEARAAAASALAEATARQHAAESAARLAEQAAQRTVDLERRGVATEVDRQRDVAAAEQQAAALDAAKRVVARLPLEQARDESDRLATIAALERDAAALDTRLAATNATVARLRLERERRVVIAPATGRVGELAELHPGAFVAAGATVASIVPVGAIRIVGFVPPAAAAGRIRVGQRVRLRLDAFPWISFGTLTGSVLRVSTEPRDGALRVDCRLAGDQPPGIPLEHGLPGTLEVEVERVRPIALLLRATGAAVQGDVTPAAPAAPAAAR